MIFKNDITQKFLMECFDYDAETGVLIWKERPRCHFNSNQGYRMFNSTYPGAIAGNRRTDRFGKNYTVVAVKGEKYFSHRLIWVMANGDWPEDQIDHIDGNGENNKISNLREASYKINSKNKRLSKRNKSGYCGVGWSKKNKKWMARITIDRKLIYLGQYKSKKAAIIRRVAAELKYGFHPNHGSDRPV